METFHFTAFNSPVGPLFLAASQTGLVALEFDARLPGQQTIRPNPRDLREEGKGVAIPYGETRTYADIARGVGSPQGFRAVGMANNRNPVAIVVPCHRVIASDGTLCGYGGGLDIKRKLLELEGALSGTLAA